MEKYLGKLNADPTPSLPEKGNLCAGYHTVRDPCRRRGDSGEVLTARKATVRSPEIRIILRLQNEDGSWKASPDSFAAANGSSTHQLIFLAELGAGGSNRRICKLATRCGAGSSLGRAKAPLRGNPSAIIFSAAWNWL